MAYEEMEKVSGARFLRAGSTLSIAKGFGLYVCNIRQLFLKLFRMCVCACVCKEWVPIHQGKKFSTKEYFSTSKFGKKIQKHYKPQNRLGIQKKIRNEVFVIPRIKVNKFKLSTVKKTPLMLNRLLEIIITFTSSKIN